MSEVKFEVVLDPNNQTQMQAATVFFATLAGQDFEMGKPEAPVVSASTESTAKIETKVAKEKRPEAATELPKKTKETTPKAEVAPKAEIAPIVEAATETPAATEEAPAEETSDNDISALKEKMRDEMTKHLPNHRPAIKAQLTKMGVKGISGLSDEQIPEMIAFFETLK